MAPKAIMSTRKHFSRYEVHKTVKLVPTSEESICILIES